MLIKIIFLHIITYIVVDLIKFMQIDDDEWSNDRLYRTVNNIYRHNGIYVENLNFNKIPLREIKNLSIESCEIEWSIDVKSNFEL